MGCVGPALDHGLNAAVNAAAVAGLTVTAVERG